MSNRYHFPMKASLLVVLVSLLIQTHSYSQCFWDPGFISPFNQTVCGSSTPTTLSLQILETEPSYSYQWKQSSSPSGTYSNVSGGSGATTKNYTPPASSATRYYKVQVTASGCTLWTGYATVSAAPALTSGAVGPAQSVCYNSSPSTLSTTVSPTGGSGSYTYQWKKSSSFGGPFNSIPGATSSSYTPPALTTTTYYVRRVTSCNTWKETIPIQVTVYPSMSNGGTINGSKTICYNTSAGTMGHSSSPNGGSGSFSYQWQRKIGSGSWTNVSGSGSSYSPGNLTTTTQFRRRATDNNGCGVHYSNTVTVNVDLLSQGGSLSGDAEAFGVNSGSLTLSGQVGSIQKWQERPSGGSWQDISHTSSSYSYSNVTTTTEYRVVIKNGVCSSANSSVATVTIHDLPSITINGPDNLAPGGSTQLNTDGGFYAYQWKKGGVNISGETSNSITITTPGSYQVTVTASNGGPVYTTGNYKIGSVVTDQPYNYITTIDYLVSGVDTTTSVFDMSFDEYTMTTQFFDGLGRGVQTNAFGTSPDGKDVISYMEYDQFNRMEKRYLPFAATDRTGLFSTTAKSDQESFYGTATEVAHTDSAYARTVFEASPLNRPLQQGAPGEAWQPGTGHVIEHAYEVNSTADAVRVWDISLTDELVNQDIYRPQPKAASLSFDGVNDYVALPLFLSHATQLPEMSAEAWVRTTYSHATLTNNWAILDFGTSQFFNLYVAGNGTVGFSTSGSGTHDMYSTGTVNDGQWHHIAVVYDGSDKMIYIDGIEDSRVVNPHLGNAIGSSATVVRYGFIGDGSNAATFNGPRYNIYYEGDIADVRLWSDRRTSAELLAFKDVELSGGEQGLMAYYNFAGDGSTLYDKSFNQFHGTLYNMDANDWITENLGFNGLYPAGELHKKITWDEEDHQVIEFTNRAGQTVLKRVQAHENGQTEQWADTYYVYDDFGNLRYVLPPEAVKEIGTPSQLPYAPSPALLAKWAFQYKYDGRKRMIEKKVPGAEPVIMIYDDRDRLVLTQDGEQRKVSKWMYTKYDRLNRPIITGITTSAQTESQLRDLLNGPDWLLNYDAYETLGGNMFGYTSNSLPKNTSINEMLTVTYYDDYSFPHASSYSFEAELGNTTAFSQVKGQVTGSKVKTLDGNNTWLESVMYYDDRYRVIQTQTQTLVGGVDRMTNNYDFVGRMLESKTTHQPINTERVEWTDVVNMTESAGVFTKTVGGWNGGSASIQQIPAGEDGSIVFTVDNKNKYRMIGLSTSNVNVSWNTIDYAIFLRNDGGLHVRESGSGNQLSSTPLYNEGDVFKIERVGSMIKYWHNGMLLREIAGTTQALIVDVSVHTTGHILEDVYISLANSEEGDIAINRTFDYDHTGRLIDTWHETEEIVEWTDLINMTSHENTISKTAGALAWDAGACSVDNIAEGFDGSLSFKANGITGNRLIGFSTTNVNQSWNTIQYAFYLKNTGILQVRESGSNNLISSTLTYADGDDFKISRHGNLIRYWHNNVLLREVVASTQSLLVDVAVSTPGHVLEEVFLNTNGSILLVHNEYNELGELIEKNLHSEDQGSTFAQSTDYRYNIRGWLTSINNAQLTNTTDNNDTGQASDYWGMELAYNDALSGVSATAAHNGNISAVRWSDNLGLGDATNIKQRAYAYTYDAMNRIKTANHSQYTSAWNGNNHFQLNGLTYDLNGNIESLTRKDESGTNMDVLGYTYDGNRLLAVSDTGSDEGFKDGTNVGDDYLYDDNGNMTRDENKDIATITYNHLNLPTRVEKDANNFILYTYDAAGIKLRQEVYEAGALSKTTDYIGEFIYENDTLQLIQHEEGRIVPALDAGPRNWIYQYHMKDHLGNTRLTFTTAPNTLEYLATMESEVAAEEEALFANLPETRVGFTSASHSPNEVAELDASEPIGPALSLPVGAGDTIRMEGYAYFEGGSGYSTTATLGSFVAAVAGAFGGLNGGTPEQQVTFDVFDNAYGTIGMQGSGNNNVPAAYLNYILFDQNMVYKQSGFKQISGAANMSSEYVSFDNDIVIPEAGFIYCFVSFENTTGRVFWDDFKVTQVEHPVIQTDDYYPFGLAHGNGYQRGTAKENRFKITGKEEQNDWSIGIYDFSARTYDASIGRFIQIDPLSDYNQESWNPYHYNYNNPIRFIDPTGMTSTEAWKKEHGISDSDVINIYSASDSCPTGDCDDNEETTEGQGNSTSTGNSDGGDGQSNEGETWYYMSREDGFPHAMAYDPSNNVIYEINHPINDEGEPIGTVNYILNLLDVGAGILPSVPRITSIAYVWDMNSERQASALWSREDGKNYLLAPVLVNDPAAAREWFKSNSGVWNYDLSTNNCSHYACQGMNAGDAEIDIPTVFIPSQFPGEFTMKWVNGSSGPTKIDK